MFTEPVHVIVSIGRDVIGEDSVVSPMSESRWDGFILRVEDILKSHRHPGTRLSRAHGEEFSPDTRDSFLRQQGAEECVHFGVFVNIGDHKRLVSMLTDLAAAGHDFGQRAIGVTGLLRGYTLVACRPAVFDWQDMLVKDEDIDW